MSSTHEKLISGILNLFPNKIKVYQLPLTLKKTREGDSSLLHQHFREPPSDEILERLAKEIAVFFNDRCPESVYSFFYRIEHEANKETCWILTTARLNKSKKGLPLEIVFFSYDLDLLGEVKERLYHVLENDLIFKENFCKVSSLTNREKETVRLLSAGMSSQEIADLLFLSVHTVNTHRRNINEKLAICL